MDSKTCTKCNKSLPINEFYKDSRTGKAVSACKTCKVNLEKERELKDTFKRCSVCKQRRKVSNFHKRWKGYHAACKDCRRIQRGYKQFESPYIGNKKICSSCKELKLLNQFSKTGRVSIVRSSCRDCCTKMDRYKKYGITEKIYVDLLKIQNYSCKVCFTRFTDNIVPVIDHDHSKNKNYRGLLCRLCNTALGYFFDNTELLEKAKQYLRKQRLKLPELKEDVYPENFKKWTRKEKKTYYNRKRRATARYGLSLAQYDYVLSNTNECEICNTKFSSNNKPNLDHCHNTNTPRGVLCKGCNFGIGLFKDNIETITNAVSYLEENR